MQFAPSYSDYVLYSDGGPADNAKRKTYRGQHGGAGVSKRAVQGEGCPAIMSHLHKLYAAACALYKPSKEEPLCCFSM